MMVPSARLKNVVVHDDDIMPRMNVVRCETRLLLLALLVNISMVCASNYDNTMTIRMPEWNVII